MDRRQALKQTAILIGGTLSASTIAGVLNGCQPSGAPDWEPQFLTKEQAKLVGAIAECILPATDSPGAKELYVDEFIDLMLKDNFSEEEQQEFIAGLTLLEENAQTANSKSFSKSSSDQQVSLLQSLEGEEESPGKTFFTTMKSLTLLGYFTSETIMSEYINHNPVPGKWEGCIDMSPDTRVSVDNNIL